MAELTHPPEAVTSAQHELVALREGEHSYIGLRTGAALRAFTAPGRREQVCVCPANRLKEASDCDLHLGGA